MTMLLDFEDLIHVKDHQGRAPLHYCVFRPHSRSIDVIHKLVLAGADVNVMDNERRTPLHHASETGNARVIPILVQKGASTNIRDGLTKKTALELAPNDHIRELLIVHSAPSYAPKKEDMVGL